MAIGTMASYTGEICVNRSEAPSWGITTAVVAGASEVYPGHIVTSTGNTAPDVARADADGDVSMGIALDGKGISIDASTKLEIDTYFPDNEPIEVARVGSRLICWAYADDAVAAQVAGTPVYNTGVDDDGFFEVLPTIDVDTAFSEAGLQGNFDAITNGLKGYVGRLYEDIADQGTTDTPEKVILV